MRSTELDYGFRESVSHVTWCRPSAFSQNVVMLTHIGTLALSNGEASILPLLHNDVKRLQASRCDRKGVAGVCMLKMVELLPRS
jgi:hypothetical protein